MNNKKVIHPLEPIYDKHTKVLILGSFPSVISRKQNFYYANPTNRFWNVLENVYEEVIDDKKEFCLRHSIGLWDVIHSCVIEGSSDSSIRDVKYNDIDSIVKKCPIQLIVTTGSKASSLYRKHFNLDVKHLSLPSTSSANARMSLNELIQEYTAIRNYTDEKD